MSKYRLWTIGILAGLGALAFACAPVINWLTPAGKPLPNAECVNLVDPAKPRPQICPARTVKHSAADEAKCKAEGGFVGMYDILMGGVYCVYPYPDAADAGKSCSKSTDCSLFCDGDTHQCAAQRGRGFWAELDENGHRVEVVQ